MNWIAVSLLSALFLGLYEIAKKESLRGNAVPPVLFCNVLTQAAAWIPLLIASQFPQSQLPDVLRVQPLDWADHARLAAKSLLAGSSWICASFALKHLPISIAAPIRATSPFATVLFAVLLLAERPSPGQWSGVAIILAAFYAFSLAGRREGIVFHKNRWITLMILATLLGAASALYDKYLLGTCGYHAADVQAWFSVYLIPVMAPLLAHWLLKNRSRSPFEWRWSIPMIAILLLISDFLYFHANEQPDALISVISPLRRTSVIIAFLAGIRLYGEQNWRIKSLCLAGLMLGVTVISLAR
jgi:drug/metabolite transporter (DMT)-like permease